MDRHSARRLQRWKVSSRIDTIETTASVLFIVTAASIFAWLLTVSQAAQTLTDAMLGITQNKWVFLLLANILILFVGCFIDTIAIPPVLGVGFSRWPSQ